MAERSEANRFVFPAWANYLLPVLVMGIIGAGLYLPVLVGFGASANTLNVGYQPEQPVPYSHALHVGELGMDCRYCHNTVDDAAFAAIPPTETCVNCHNPAEGEIGIRKTSEGLAPVVESYNTGEPIPWVKVHDLGDYAYFNHEAHVTKGVSCVECHGRVDRMEVVYQAEPLSMAWCLDCHRDPAPHLRPVEEVTNLAWEPELREGETLAEAKRRVGEGLMEKYDIHDQAYMVSCSTCHR
ncbi:MAG: cytochrome c3 family protein [Phycisphaeraceae bacterium]